MALEDWSQFEAKYSLMMGYWEKWILWIFWI